MDAQQVGQTEHRPIIGTAASSVNKYNRGGDALWFLFKFIILL